MQDNTQDNPRRSFLLRSAAGAASAAALALPQGAQAQRTVAGRTAEKSIGYRWLLPSEQGFVEALVNHMCPADNHSPNGMEMGLHTYFDQALGGEWGQGARLYLKGPFLKGTANQGYQLGLTPAQLFRAGTEGLALYCAKTHGKPFESLSAANKEVVLQGLQANRIALPNEVPANVYFAHLYQLFVEGMFSDPIYGGNRDKMGWKMIGYPGVSTNNRQNIVRFKNLPYKPEPTSISDVS